MRSGEWEGTQTNEPPLTRRRSTGSIAAFEIAALWLVFTACVAVQLWISTAACATPNAAEIAVVAHEPDSVNTTRPVSRTTFGFQGLDALFSEATLEYDQGANWMTEAGSASGNQQLLDGANAATRFANAQAHGQQVCDAIVSPATQSVALGLPAYIPDEYGFQSERP